MAYNQDIARFFNKPLQLTCSCVECRKKIIMNRIKSIMVFFLLAFAVDTGYAQVALMICFCQRRLFLIFRLHGC